jgi:hypothetical protein
LSFVTVRTTRRTWDPRIALLADMKENTDNLMPEVEDLYGMVQDCKNLLILWNRHTTLTVQQKRDLKTRTKELLGTSSSRIIRRALDKVDYTDA